VQVAGKIARAADLPLVGVVELSIAILAVPCAAAPTV